MEERLVVTTHVSRDFLQNAAYFNTLPKVIWEYVSNSLDNGRDGIPITVVVDISKEDDLVIIADNGSGMSRDDLKRFFTMHGENVQRKKGKRVRGRFGTGKSAAFGIAKRLTIETRHAGKKNVVSLHVDQIRTASSGNPFFVEEIIKDQETTEEDGTIVRIQELLLNRLDIDTVISLIEKHLARYHLKASVIINNHQCRFKEPPSVEEVTVNTPTEVENILGICQLQIKVAPFSLEKDERGIDILSDGIWHETTLGEVEGREFSDRLFGEVDVPIFEKVEDDIAPFDNTRNNVLNRANPRVVVLIAWISQELEKVRQELVLVEKEKRKTEQAKKLEQQANRMASILNEDFQNLMLELDISKKISGKSKAKSNPTNSDSGEPLPGIGDLETKWEEAGQPHGHGTKGINPPGIGDTPRPGPSLIPGQSNGSPQQSDSIGQKRRSGVFSIEFRNLTEEAERTKYQAEDHLILINLDHPQIALALKQGGGSQDSNHFLSMVYEVATVAYSQTIPFERIRQGEQVDAADALFSVGDTIERITRKFSHLLLEKSES